MYESCPGLGSRKMIRQEVIHGWSMTPDYTTWEKIMPLLIPKIIQFEGLQKKQSAKTKFPSAAHISFVLKDSQLRNSDNDIHLTN